MNKEIRVTLITMVIFFVLGFVFACLTGKYVKYIASSIVIGSIFSFVINKYYKGK